MKARYEEPEWRRFVHDQVLSHPSRGRVLDLRPLTRAHRKRSGLTGWLRYGLVGVVMWLAPAIGIVCLAFFALAFLFFIYVFVAFLQFVLGAS